MVHHALLNFLEKLLATELSMFHIDILLLKTNVHLLCYSGRQIIIDGLMGACLAR
jgi:hypothetical protein